MRVVRDVMSTPVITVQPETPLKEVARRLLDRGISGVPVVDGHGAVVGVVSEADFLAKQQGAAAVRHHRLARIMGESRASRARRTKLDAATAGEAMTAPAVVIGSARPISEAAGFMTARKVNRLPVVDDGRLVGIVTRADLVRAFVRSDDELASSIREDIILRILWLDPAQFTVTVIDGVATVSGRVERRSTAEMLERAVGMIPGIVRARVRVTWSMDDSRPDPVLDSVSPFVLR